MPLNSYLKDLLRGSSGLQVNIVNDNAVCLQEESTSFREMTLSDGSSSRSTSLRDFAKSGRMGPSSGKPSRWSGGRLLPRGHKCDSALGKPKRRGSADTEELWAEACSTVLDLVGDGSTSMADDQDTEKGQLEEPSSRSLPLRSFSESRGKKSKKSERRTIQETKTALHIIRSRGANAPTSTSLPSNKTSASRTGSISSSLRGPPSKPTRKPSSEELTLEASSEVVQNFEKQTKSRQRATTPAKDSDLMSWTSAGRSTTADFPDSLRELPYQAAAPSSA